MPEETMTASEMFKWFSPSLLAQVVCDMYATAVECKRMQDTAPYMRFAARAHNELVSNVGLEAGLAELIDARATPACILWFVQHASE